MRVDHVDLVNRSIPFSAPPHVREVIATLGRTEDVKLSPSNRRVAVIDHFKDRIVIFDLSVRNRLEINLENSIEITSSYLKRPHGLDFVDDNKFIVANRDGCACIFEIPAETNGQCVLEPTTVLNYHEIASPGSVAVVRREDGLDEAVICNDYTNKITKHVVDVKDGCSIKRDTLLLNKWIRFPDGICVSKNREWIAVSNHNTHAVFVYRNDRSLNPLSAPDAILRHYYPHGLHFAADDRFILAASAGAPYINIYEAPDSNWRGVHSPSITAKVLSDEDYLRCRISREDGGPKGIDIDDENNLLVVTCENQPLAFYDLASILKSADSKSAFAGTGSELDSGALHRATNAVHIRYQLYLGEFVATSTAYIRWILTKFPILSWTLNAGRKLWNPKFLTKPF